jgi:hypothetical protein
MRAGLVALAIGMMAATSIGLQAEPPLSGSQASSSAMNGTEARALLDKYCVGCHNDKLKAGSLVLTSVDVNRIGDEAAMWEKVVRKLRGRLMPPSGRPRPDDHTYEGFTAWLESGLDSFGAAHPNPGRTETFRRLNRTEYQNAIRDLLAIDLDVSGFVPADDAAGGFDNIGGVFKLSPTLMESYLSAAKKIADRVMGKLPSVSDDR